MTLTTRTPLQRRTPLTASTGLQRKTPLRTTVALRPSTPERAQKAAAARGRSTGGVQPFPAAACALIDLRDSDTSGAVPIRLCQRCGSARNPQRHHRRGKEQGGSGRRKHSQCACNGVTLCGPWRGNPGCHAYVHAHPEEARAEGWIVSQAVDEPGSAGVMRFAAAEGGATQWPDCRGNWLETEAEAGEAA